MLSHLTRHAQPGPWAAAAGDDEGSLGGDPALTDVGVQQARLLKQHLRELGFAGRIGSSPYRRSAQTADPLAGELGLRFGVTPALRDNQMTQAFTARAGRSDLGTWFGAWNAQLTTFEIRRNQVRIVRLADVSFLPRELVTADTDWLVEGYDARTGARWS